MRFLILDAEYPQLTHDRYAREPGLEKAPYQVQNDVRFGEFFALAGVYPRILRALGHEAEETGVNVEPLQAAWAREHGLPIDTSRRWKFWMRRGVVPWFGRRANGRWLLDVLAAQIKAFRPDVLLNHDMWGAPPSFLREIRPYIRFLIGQHAATTLPERPDWGEYDLMISSFLPTVEWFRSRGVRAELSRLAFDPLVLEALPTVKRDVPVSFVGSFQKVHVPRTALLEQLAELLPIKVWGPSPGDGFKGSPLERCYQGPAWGLDMFKVLARSRITINHHGDVAPYANNMRLYEATGVGTLLVTDWKPNLHEIFDPGKEVVTYRTPEECAQAIEYFLAHEDERKAIALAGQQRTLRDHTYRHRVQELIDFASRHI